MSTTSSDNKRIEVDKMKLDWAFSWHFMHTRYTPHSEWVWS